MKLVSFEDGTYGIRRLSIIGYQYLDFASNGSFWWGRSGLSNFKDCKTDEVTARRVLSMLQDKGMVVK